MKGETFGVERTLILETTLLTDDLNTAGTLERKAESAEADRSLLLVDDDKPFLERLTRAMESRGFAVSACASVAEGLAAIARSAPAFAVVDMRLGDGNGLDVISELKAKRPDARGIILTGYGNITTAVTAVKLGAFDYLAKPADADEIFHALMASQHDRAEMPENPMSADRVRWEHIQRIYELCGRNVSETARRLGMHRRTLQRILAKRAPR
ncbi:MAG: ActR/PrrA/RegA family redox response regulator transcription factor [Beijerinckiaceae bacterium]